MLVRESRTSPANGAFGRQDRHDSAGMRVLTAASMLDCHTPLSSEYA
jgi:hypothetical protein